MQQEKSHLENDCLILIGGIETRCDVAHPVECKSLLSNLYTSMLSGVLLTGSLLQIDLTLLLCRIHSDAVLEISDVQCEPDSNFTVKLWSDNEDAGSCERTLPTTRCHSW